MADEVTGGIKFFRMGEEKPFRVRIREAQGADLSTLTATLEIADSAGSPVLAATAMTVSGSKSVIAVYQVTCKAGGTLTTDGDFPATVRWTYQGIKRAKQYLIRVRPAPEL